jgi:SseB protein N-terminal domain
VVQLSAGDPRFRSDNGGADPAVTSALAEYAAGTGTEYSVLTALAGARLLVPVVAVRADELEPDDHAPGHGDACGSGDNHGDKASEMAMPAIVGADGRRALPAFTSLETLQRWQRDARPVPVPAEGVWQSAVQESQAVIIDLAGPVPLAVEGARLAALASGDAVPHLHEDPDVRATVAAVAAAQPPGLRIRLGPPRGDADFTLELTPADPAAPVAVTDEVARAFADEVASSLGERVRRGIALVIPAEPPGGRPARRGRRARKRRT